MDFLDLKKTVGKLLNAIKEIVSLSSKTYSVGSYASVIAQRNGRLVVIQISSTTGHAYSTGWTTLCTLDTIYRPLSRRLSIIYDNSSTSASTIPMVARIEPSGAVQVYRFSNNGSNTTPCGTIPYLV